MLCAPVREYHLKFLTASTGKEVMRRVPVYYPPMDLYHTTAILSPRRTKSFVFARLASHRMTG